MEKHSSRPGNPTIAQVFYFAGFIESWGRGIEKICEACTADGIPLPEYTIHPSDVMVKFSTPAERIVLGPGEAVKTIPERLGKQVTAEEAAVLAVLMEDPGYSYDAIAKKLSVGRTPISTRIKALKNKGLIERVGSDKDGYWRILD